MVLAVTLTSVASAQSRAASTAGLNAVLARGWTALASGDMNTAAATAQAAMAEYPHSVAALALAVEVAIARGGAPGGLDAYERWLGNRRLDAAHVLRRIATVHLHEIARRRETGAAQVEALKFLVEDGDPEILARLAGGPASPLEVQLLASTGDERAVQALVQQLHTAPNKSATIDALAESRSPQAAAALVRLLSDTHDEIRASAAEALGEVGVPEAIAYLTPLLQDERFPVRLAAAKALYRLGDDSGLGLLESLLLSEHSAFRIAAAEALSVRPGGAWQAVARELTADPDEMVRLKAAELLAPYDRDLARQVVDGLRQSENPAVREEAGRVITERIAADFATLRHLLRDRDPLTGVRAAGRILELTR